MTQFSAILVGNESLTRHAAETLLARGHRIEAIVTRSPELRDWAAGAGLRVEDQDAPVPADAPVADWLFSVANLSILRPEMLARGQRGAINFHDGPLPTPAGLNAPVWAIIGGEAVHELGFAFVVIPVFINAIILLSVAMGVGTFRQKNPFDVNAKTWLE